MSFENVEVVRHIYGVWEKEGSPVASELLDPEIEWVNPPETSEGVDVRIDEMLDAGDQVVVLATLRGRARGSGADVERRQGYIWTLRDGKATRFERFNTPDDALRAAGLHC
jgi:ketosteroid isomerase-like protein